MSFGIETFGIPSKKRILYKDIPININFTKKLRHI